MKCERVSLSDSNEPFIAFNMWNRGSDNRPEREKMKRFLKLAMRIELTDRQRYCVIEHYYGGKKMTEIAEALGVSKSTVSRHISSALRKIKRVSRYIQ